MRIAYQKGKSGIEIIRCWCEGSRIRIPGEIEKIPVVSVGRYAFSPGYTQDLPSASSEPPGRTVSGRSDRTRDLQKKREETFYYEEYLRNQEKEEPVFCGDAVVEVEFPASLEAIGNYAFYGCRNLRRLVFSDRLHRLGAGVFTGCRQKMELQIDLYDGEETCLKEICGEVRYELEAVLRHHLPGQETAVEEAHLIFPEHYEEAVENTPARILFTQHHGTGNHFRQCFLAKKLQYRDYDALFPLAEAQESLEVLSELVYGRLAYPYQLGGRAKERYRKFIRENAAGLAAVYLRQERLAGLRTITEQGGWTEEALEQAIQAASEGDSAVRQEAVSHLVQERRRLFPPRKKTFEL